MIKETTYCSIGLSQNRVIDKTTKDKEKKI